MADDLLQEVLQAPSDINDKEKHDYFAHLAGLSASALERSEANQLAESSHSLLVAIQSLSKRSHKPVISSISSYDLLGQSLPALHDASARLRLAIPRLDKEALKFSTTYNKASGHLVLTKRRKDLALLRNVERLVDVMELPSLMLTTISSGPLNHSLAMDLHSHVRRLVSVHQDSPLVAAIGWQADSAIHQLAYDLVQSLDATGLKLAAGMRSIGLLRRVLAEIASADTRGTQDGALGLVFLLRRLSTLATTLTALKPLRRLAENEKAQQASSKAASLWSGGQHTERYLRRYVEIFREHSFGIVSMYKSIFAAPTASLTSRMNEAASESRHVLDPSGSLDPLDPLDPLQPLPSPLSTFVLNLSGLLLDTLGEFLPVVRDQASRHSILTQVLYCAGSLARLSGDFGLLLAGVGLSHDVALEQKEWVNILKRHRQLTGRLETALSEFKR